MGHYLGLIQRFAKLSLQELDDFHQGDDQKCQAERNQVSLCVQVREAEQLGEEINFHNSGSQQEGTHHGTVEGNVVVSFEEHTNSGIAL